jgi:hypothetical protein
MRPITLYASGLNGDVLPPGLQADRSAMRGLPAPDDATMQRAARRPVGYVDSAVMLNAKLAKGQTLMHVLARTRSIGERVDSAGGDAKGGIEAYAWRDAGGSRVVAQFSRGRLVAWTLDRSQDSPAEGAP